MITNKKNFLMRWKHTEEQWVLFLMLFVFVLVSCPKVSTAQMPAAVSSASSKSVGPSYKYVNSLFLPVMPQIKRNHPRIPVLLPAFIARQKQFGPLAPDWRITQTSYSIGLGDALKRPISRDFPFPASYYSFYGQAVRTKQAPHNGKRVALVGGITGWYSPTTSKDPDTSGMISWRYKTGDYSIGLVQGTQAELVAMANSAIQHPVQSQPAAPSHNTDFVNPVFRLRHARILSVPGLDSTTHVVHFARGRNFTTIVGTMGPYNGETDNSMTSYIVKAHKGQTLAVRLNSTDKRVFFDVMNPVFDVNRDNDLLYWYRLIEKTGEYDIRVVSDKYGDHSNKLCTYTLHIKLSGR